MIFVPLNTGLSVTFALLARGDKKMHSTSVIGIVLSVLSVIAAIVMIVILSAVGMGLVTSFVSYQVIS